MDTPQEAPWERCDVVSKGNGRTRNCRDAEPPEQPRTPRSVSSDGRWFAHAEYSTEMDVEMFFLAPGIS